LQGKARQHSSRSELTLFSHWPSQGGGYAARQPDLQGVPFHHVSLLAPHHGVYSGHPAPVPFLHPQSSMLQLQALQGSQAWRPGGINDMKVGGWMVVRSCM